MSGMRLAQGLFVRYPLQGCRLLNDVSGIEHDFPKTLLLRRCVLARWKVATAGQ